MNEAIKNLIALLKSCGCVYAECEKRIEDIPADAYPAAIIEIGGERIKQQNQDLIIMRECDIIISIVTAIENYESNIETSESVMKKLVALYPERGSILNDVSISKNETHYMRKINYTLRLRTAA